MNLLSQHLRKIRMEKGLNAKDMANALKITPSTYSRIETGQTSVKLEMAHKIADIVKKPINEVFTMPHSNYEVTNGDNSPLAIDNSTLVTQNEKLVEAVLKLSEQVTKTNEQQLLIMQNQNDILKEFVKLKKAI